MSDPDKGITVEDNKIPIIDKDDKLINENKDIKKQKQECPKCKVIKFSDYTEYCGTCGIRLIILLSMIIIVYSADNTQHVCTAGYGGGACGLNIIPGNFAGWDNNNHIRDKHLVTDNEIRDLIGLISINAIHANNVPNGVNKIAMTSQLMTTIFRKERDDMGQINSIYWLAETPMWILITRKLLELNGVHNFRSETVPGGVIVAVVPKNNLLDNCLDALNNHNLAVSAPYCPVNIKFSLNTGTPIEIRIRRNAWNLEIKFCTTNNIGTVVNLNAVTTTSTSCAFIGFLRDAQPAAILTTSFPILLADFPVVGF